MAAVNDQSRRRVRQHDRCQGVTDSFNAVPNALEDMVRKQLTDLQQRGQKVITCTYGPINTQAYKEPGT